jgi:hypothetical protein
LLAARERFDEDLERAGRGVGGRRRARGVYSCRGIRGAARVGRTETGAREAQANERVRGGGERR